MIELVRALGALTGPPTPSLQAVADAVGLGRLPDASEHAELFLFQLPPYASIYLGAEGMLGGEARDRVAGFWRAVGLRPPTDPDELGALLGLYATLAGSAQLGPGRAQTVLLQEGARALLHEHLTPWLAAYTARVAEADTTFYRHWADLLRGVLRHEAERLGSPDALPLHLRQAPTLPDPREQGGEGFLAALLTPARSGMILTRADLGRAARAAGLGLRAGERRYALESMLAQDAAETLEWLRREAREWVDRHRGDAAISGAPVAEFWQGRASSTADLLADLVREAQESVPCVP